jgi:hypothetical protein
MKKYLSIGMLTVCALVISEHQAQAWVNSKFNIGLSWNLQSGNNSYLWGLWRNGQVPGPEPYGPGPGGPPPGPPYAFGNAPPQGNLPQGAYTQAIPQGTYPQAQPTGYPQGYPQNVPQGVTMQTAPPPLQASAQQPAYAAPNMGWYNQNPYQTVSYQPNANGYAYPQPNYNYYYPAYQAQVPYYWYGSR